MSRFVSILSAVSIVVAFVGAIASFAPGMGDDIARCGMRVAAFVFLGCGYATWEIANLTRRTR